MEQEELPSSSSLPAMTSVKLEPGVIDSSEEVERSSETRSILANADLSRSRTHLIGQPMMSGTSVPGVPHATQSSKSPSLLPPSQEIDPALLAIHLSAVAALEEEERRSLLPPLMVDMSPQNQLANGVAQQQQQAPEVGRPLNVTDALTYLDAVKNQFHDNPDVYNQFLDIMKDFKSQVIDTPGVIQRVSRLFHGNPALIEGFNTFLPVGYRIEVSVDPLDPNKITVTTPLGTTTQSTNTHINLSRLTREVPGPPIPAQHQPPSVPPSSSQPLPPSQHPLQPPPQHLTPVPIYPGPSPLMPTIVGPSAIPGAPGSRSMTPHGYPPMGHGQGQPYIEPIYSPGPNHQMAAAEHLHNLNGQKPLSSSSATQVEKQPPGEFNHAIQYLNKIKARYAEDPNTYKQFLDILQTYHKEQKHSHDVYVQVQMLFADAPDLLAEFKDFLPEAVPISAGGTAPIPIMPQPGAGGSAWQGESPPSSQKKVQPSNKRKKPQKVEKESTPVPPPRPVASSSRTKRVKQHHTQEAEQPGFSPYHQPPSPPPSHTYPSSQPSHPQLQHTHSGHVAEYQNNPSAGKLLFFDKAKKHLENREVYEEFLKFLDLFSRDILDLPTLVERSKVFFGDGELMTAFKDLVGWDDRDNLEKGPPGSIRTGPPEIPSALPLDDGEGPSYRRLPPSEALLACSGRDEMCRSVLNDDWISHPTWASEEAGFVVTKKTPFEEALHKSEEERHEYHFQIESLSRTIAVLEPINSRIDEMTNEERASFRLKPDFGGSGTTIYHRIIKKIYGRDMGAEVVQALQDCPSVAVPVVVNRLKVKHEEWKRAQRDWSRTWREVDHKNYYKSLDYQGINFKQNDKKSITTKHFVMDIQDAKKQQMKKWERKGWQLFNRGGPPHQIEFHFKNTIVLHDALKMVYAFLERTHATYSSLERRGIEKFLRSFVPVMLMSSEPDFNGGLQLDPSSMDEDSSGNLEGGQKSNTSGRKSVGTPQSQAAAQSGGGGVPANDLRRKLLKTAQEKANSVTTPGRKDARGSASGLESRAQSPAGGTRSPRGSKADEELDPPDVWIKETSRLNSHESFSSSNDKERPFFANTTFYTLFRLLELLYSRLLMCHQIGAKYAAEKHASLLNNPVAVDLGLDDPNGPATVLAQTIELLGKPLAEDTNVVYLYLLTACEKLFDNEMDQITFEEHMRWFFGTRAYTLFTLDKLITALIKQVQAILGDNKCLELWLLLKSAQSSKNITSQDIIRYRREAERHVGPDDHLYRLQWIREPRCMRVWLCGSKEASGQTDGSATARWREYVSTYVMSQPTEWLPEPRKETTPVFLRRCLRMAEEGTAPLVNDHMRIRISLPTYKLVYEAGSEDLIVHDWGKDEEEMRIRARNREEERRRNSWLR